MIDGLKPYDEYRPSAHPWLDKVPAHWLEKRAKYFFREVDERSTTGEEDLLSVSHKTGVTPRPQHVTMFKAESNVGHKICRPADLAINTMWAFMGALGVSRQVGLVSPSYGIYRPINDGELHPNYVDRLLRTDDYKSEYLCRSTGIRSSRLRLYPDEFLKIPIPCPPHEEQAAIVRFLDHADRRIRRYIRAKRQLIALLNEQKQAIIHRAVTRGLDPHVKLKPSGVEWLGDVPEHWNIKRMKAIGRIRYGLGQPPREIESGLPLLRATNVDHGKIVSENLIHVDPDDVPKGRNAFLSEGEIIVVRSGAYTADSAIIPPEYVGSVAGYDMVLTVTNASPQFVALALLSTYLRDDQLILSSLRAAQPHLNAEELGQSVILLPPLPEQKAIARQAETLCWRVDETAREVSHEMQLIQEYRIRLIADVVTGKLDIREAAAALPDELETVESDAEDLLDDDDNTDDVDLDTEPEEVEA